LLLRPGEFLARLGDFDALFAAFAIVGALFAGFAVFPAFVGDIEAAV